MRGRNGTARIVTVKIARVVTTTLAVTLLAVASGVRLNPSFLILLSRDVQIRSPFCSTWKASLDGHIKLRQQALQKKLTEASHVVWRDAGLAL